MVVIGNTAPTQPCVGETKTWIPQKSVQNFTGDQHVQHLHTS